VKTYKKRRFYEPQIIHALQGEKHYIAETPDFIETLFHNDRYIAIFNTSDYGFLLIRFSRKEDAETFKKTVIKLAEALSELPYSYTGRSPFFISKQRKLIKTMLSYFDDEIKIVCWLGHLNPETFKKHEDVIL